MATVTITVCDVCGEEGLEVWNVHGPKRSYLAELCEEHSEQFVEALRQFIPDVGEDAPTRKGVLTPDFEARIRTDL